MNILEKFKNDEVIIMNTPHAKKVLEELGLTESYAPTKFLVISKITLNAFTSMSCISKNRKLIELEEFEDLLNTKNSLEKNKKVYTCQTELPEIITDDGHNVFKFNYMQSFTIIKNLKHEFYVIRHAVISKEMIEMFTVGKELDIIMTTHPVKIEDGKFLLVNGVLQRIEGLTLVQLRTEHTLGEVEDYRFVFRKEN